VVINFATFVATNGGTHTHVKIQKGNLYFKNLNLNVAVVHATALAVMYVADAVKIVQMNVVNVFADTLVSF